MGVSSCASKTCQMYTDHIKVSKHNKSLNTQNTEAQQVLHIKIKLSTCCICRRSEDYRAHNMTSPLFQRKQHLFISPFSSYFIYFIQQHLQYIQPYRNKVDIIHSLLSYSFGLWTTWTEQQTRYDTDNNIGRPYTELHISKYRFVASDRRGVRNLNTLTTTCAAYSSLLSMQLHLWLIVTLRETKQDIYKVSRVVHLIHLPDDEATL